MEEMPMGLGGHLTWTAVAAAVKKEKQLPVLAIENNSICEFSPIFKNNSNFTFNPDKDYYKINISDPRLHYLVDHGDKVSFTTKRHVIEHICQNLNLKDFKLKCELYLTESEQERAEKIASNLPAKYICIEPYSKMSWSQGREYPFSKWQNVVNSLKDTFSFVQVGKGGQRPLENVTDLSGKPSFRECSHILKRSSLLLASEGGIVHLANAANTKSIVIFTSFHVYPSTFHYKENTIIDISLYRNKIGGYKNHPLFGEERNLHNEQQIIEAVLKETEE